MSAYTTVLDRLAAVTGHQPRVIGDRAMARCPAHQDGSPSLSLRRATDRTLVHCHAGCATADVLAALDLVFADLYDAPPERGWRRPYVPPRPPATPLGIEYTTEPPDVPDMIKRTWYAAATAHVDRGCYPGNPVEWVA